MMERHVCKNCGLGYQIAIEGPCELCGGEKVPVSEVEE